TLLAVDPIFAQANREACPALSRQIPLHSKQFPNSEHAAQLLGLLCEHSEEFGKPVQPYSLIHGSGEYSLRSVSKWTDFIEDWEFTPGTPFKAVGDLKKAPLTVGAPPRRPRRRRKIRPAIYPSAVSSDKPPNDHTTLLLSPAPLSAPRRPVEQPSPLAPAKSSASGSPTNSSWTPWTRPGEPIPTRSASQPI
ncbi:MAG: hypothetical protein ACPGVU_09070, partial [Limisphaerales bacterium]